MPDQNILKVIKSKEQYIEYCDLLETLIFDKSDDVDTIELLETLINVYDSSTISNIDLNKEKQLSQVFRNHADIDTNKNNYYDGLSETAFISVMEDVKRILNTDYAEKYPKYVMMGNVSLRRVGNQYWCDGGDWGVDFRIENNKLYSQFKGDGLINKLNNVELIKITKQEWEKNNPQYNIEPDDYDCGDELPF